MLLVNFRDLHVYVESVSRFEEPGIASNFDMFMLEKPNTVGPTLSSPVIGPPHN